MANTKMNEHQGHWFLAKVGKRVLRPGGLELTRKMMDALDIKSTDEVVEFAPGLGLTAEMALQKRPKSYTGVELNKEAAAKLQRKINGPNKKIVVANAASSGFPSESVDKVWGEAMLTMQASHRKSEIIREAARILKPGGYYAIHELGLTPETMPEEDKAGIQKGLAKSIKVNARPMTVPEWKKYLEDEGFEVIAVHSNNMDLLKPERVIADEGFFRALKIGFNVLTHPKIRKRILGMKNTFQRYYDNLNAVTIIARKKGEA